MHTRAGVQDAATVWDAAHGHQQGALGDADAGRPCLPTHAPCAGRRQAEQETAAAWSLPQQRWRRVGDAHECGQAEGQAKASGGHELGQWGGLESFRCWRIFRITSLCVMGAMIRSAPADSTGSAPSPAQTRASAIVPNSSAATSVRRLILHTLLAWRRDHRPTPVCAAPDSRWRARWTRGRARGLPASPRVPWARAPSPWCHRTRDG